MPRPVRAKLLFRFDLFLLSLIKFYSDNNTPDRKVTESLFRMLFHVGALIIGRNR